MLQFKGKVALITGASSGIGEGTALHLASLGCSLSLTGRNITALAHVAEKCKARGVPNHKVLIVQGDIRSADDVAAIVKRTAEYFGRIDILVNNAGVIKIGALEEMSLDDFDNEIRTNLRSAFKMTQEAVSHLKKTKGNIVNVSSMVSLRTVKNVAPYSISKAGLDQLTYSSALEFSRYGIRVNSVNPAVIDTKMKFGHIRNAEEREKAISEMGSLMPLGRVGKVEDVAQAIAFLASDAASFITGHALPVDGGCMLTGMPPLVDPKLAGASGAPSAAVLNPLSGICLFDSKEKLVGGGAGNEKVYLQEGPCNADK